MVERSSPEGRSRHLGRTKRAEDHPGGTKDMMRRIAAGLVAVGLISVGAEASAQSYTRSSSSRTYSSISTTGSFVSLSESDEGYGSFSAPFSFTLNGATV